MTLLLMAIGLMVGTFGTLIGAGGGFILMPILLLLYPQESPETLTAISLAVVFFNALSGSIAYAVKRRIHYRSAIVFSLASAPSALLGAYATSYFRREWFELVFGILMTAMAVYLLISRQSSIDSREFPASNYKIYRLIDNSGNEHFLSYNLPLGIAVSVVVGFLSSLLGIGGGIIHVPALVNLLNFPVHIATATSHAILAVVSAVGTGEHILAGKLDGTFERVVALVPGVIIGAQLGAFLSHHVNDKWIIRALALALLSLGVRFVLF